MFKETKAKISEAMKAKKKIKSKPVSEVRAWDLDLEDMNKDLDNFKFHLKSLSSVTRRKSNLEEDENRKEFFKDFVKNRLLKG